MQEYFNDGLLPDGYIQDLMFSKMLEERTGTVYEACTKAAKEVIDEHKELLYSYSWELEGYADLYLECCRKGKATLWKALEYAMYIYLVDEVLKYNVYTFLENYVELRLLQSGVKKREIDGIRSYLLRFVDYNLLDTDIGQINLQVKRYASTHRLP